MATTKIREVKNVELFQYNFLLQNSSESLESSNMETSDCSLSPLSFDYSLRRPSRQKTKHQTHKQTGKNQLQQGK